MQTVERFELRPHPQTVMSQQTVVNEAALAEKVQNLFTAECCKT